VINRRQKAGEVDPANHLSALWRDAGDAIGLPDIGENLSLDEFQFIQLVDRLVPIVDFDSTLFRERVAVQNADLSGPVAHEKVTAIGGETPSFAGVSEGAQQFEVAEVVDKSGLGLPGELHHCVSEESDSLTEKI
jgi:hypothetical protein